MPIDPSSDPDPGIRRRAADVPFSPRAFVITLVAADETERRYRVTASSIRPHKSNYGEEPGGLLVEQQTRDGVGKPTWTFVDDPYACKSVLERVLEVLWDQCDPTDAVNFLDDRVIDLGRHKGTP